MNSSNSNQNNNYQQDPYANQQQNQQPPMRRGMTVTNIEAPQHGQQQQQMPQNAHPMQGQYNQQQQMVPMQMQGGYGQPQYGAPQGLPPQAYGHPQSMPSAQYKSPEQLYQEFYQYNQGSKKWSAKGRAVVGKHGQAFLNEEESTELRRMGYLYKFSVGAALLTFPLSFHFARQITRDKAKAKTHVARSFAVTVSGVLLLANAIYRQGAVEEEYADRYLWPFSLHELDSFDHNEMMNVQRIHNMRNWMVNYEAAKAPPPQSSTPPPTPPQRQLTPQQMAYKSMQGRRIDFTGVPVDRDEQVKAMTWEGIPSGQPKN